jgi:hypothetical protein
MPGSVLSLAVRGEDIRTGAETSPDAQSPLSQSLEPTATVVHDAH